MNTVRLLDNFYSTPWAIADGHLKFIESALISAVENKDEKALEVLNAKKANIRNVEGNIAVVPIRGAIGHRSSFLSEYFGWPSTEKLSQDISSLASDSSVGGIVLDIDSPGGMAVGNQELHDVMMSIRGSKPIIAVANGMAASAAYYIASAADKIAITPSGEVGSIGTVMVHADMSQVYKNAGIDITVIKAGKYKWEGNSYEPLSDEAKANLQDNVNRHYDMFVNAVAVGRGVSKSKVKNDFGEGRMVAAQQSVDVGMTDEVATLQQVLERMTGKKKKKTYSAEMYALKTRQLSL